MPRFQGVPAPSPFSPFSNSSKRRKFLGTFAPMLAGSVYSLERVDSMMFMVEKKHREEQTPVSPALEMKSRGVVDVRGVARAFAESPL